MAFKDAIIKRAKLLKKVIIFPEAEDERVLQAAAQLQKKGIVIPILIGNPAIVAEIARKAKTDIKGLQLLNPEESSLTEPLAKELYKLRRRKGVNLQQAKKLIHDPFLFGAMLVRKEVAHGMVCGATRPTKETIKAAAWCIGTKKGVKTASSIFFMDFSKETLVYGDCGFNINPNHKQLADIAIESAKTAEQFGIPAKVAMLSCRTHGSATHDDITKVIKATKLVQKRKPKLVIDGEIQFDTAYDADIQKIKAPKSSLKGPASVYIFPNLDSGNIAYKITQQLAKAQAYGPILQGFTQPINDLSRGCSVDDIIVIAAITALQTLTKPL